MNIIRDSYSPWSAPVWLVPKKQNKNLKKEWRLVVDFRKLNEKTVKDRYPMPVITDVRDKLGKATYFSALDLASGYYQIEMTAEDMAKTAFSAEGGHYEFTRMPFGLTNSPATFQRVMDNVFKELIGKCCLIYLDDIIIFSSSLQEHMQDLHKVFSKLKSTNLKLQVKKSEFLRKNIEYLGHVISADGIKPNPNKLTAIKNFTLPKTRKEIKSFLGLLGYYRKFIRDFARITKPLTTQLKGKKTVKIDQNFIDTFEICKTLLCNDPISQYPDFSKQFILTTDASNVALGAVLSQGSLGSDKPVSFASRTLNETEQNYSTVEKEMLAIIWAIKYFRPYLFGKKFKIVTDHRPLTWLMNFKEPGSKLVRWRLKLLEYEFEIVYKKGSQNVVADALSRINVEINCNDIETLEDTAGFTFHSDQPNDNIHISEKPLNDFRLQLILEEGPNSESFTIVPFKNKVRQTIISPEFNLESIAKTLKILLKPNKICAVLYTRTTDKIFNLIQKAYSQYFAHSNIYKLVKCKIFLTDLIGVDNQEKKIRTQHENSNHRGADEVTLKLKREFYFPNMNEKVKQIIQNCNVCKTLKYDRNPPKQAYQKTETPDGPLNIVHTDLYTINGRYVVTIIDKFSKFAASYTIPTRDSINTTRAILQFIQNFGIPKKLICDQGAEFQSNLFKSFCSQYNIDLHTTSFQQSSSNAPVERLHSTMTEIYRIIIDRKSKEKLECDHEEILSETLITYNNAVHSATKLTPFELFSGRTHFFNKNIKFDNYHDYLTKLNTFRKDLYPKIKKQVDQAKITKIQKLNEDRHEPLPVTPNQTIHRKENRRNKLTARFTQQIVHTDAGPTLLTKRKQKLHKSKIRRNINRIVNKGSNITDPDSTSTSNTT